MTADGGHSPRGADWQRAHPAPVAEHVDAPDVWPDDATRDRFVGDWHLYQRRGGHRTSTDDQLTAWSAARWWDHHRQRPPARYLDLGCGIGSVLLASAHALRPELSLGVEAQPQSVRLARRTIAELPDPPEIRVELGDLRAITPQALGRFDLITGSPPYIPSTDGIMARDPQRRACRFEVRGGVEAYCETAALMLSPGATFHLVFQTIWDERVLAAGRAAGLHLVGRVDARMREGSDDPFLTVYAFALTPAPVEQVELTIRSADGDRTEAYDAARRRLGLSQLPSV